MFFLPNDAFSKHKKTSKEKSVGGPIRKKKKDAFIFQFTDFRDRKDAFLKMAL